MYNPIIYSNLHFFFLVIDCIKLFERELEMKKTFLIAEMI